MTGIKLITCILICSVSMLCYTQEPIPTSKGFNGYLRAGYGFLHFRNNQVAQFMSYKLNEQTISTINSVPEPQNTGILTLPMEIGYTIVPYKTHVFIGNQIEDLIRFDVTQQIGIKQRVKSVGVIQAGLLYTGLTTKVWEDPFLTGSEREATRRTAFGALLSLEQIATSGFSVQYSYRDVKIDSELSGQELGLSPENEELLKRNGDMHRLSIRYLFFFKQKHRISPRLELVRDKREGAARSRFIYDFSLNYMINFKTKYTLISNALIGQAKYDQENPIYTIRQQDMRYGLTASLLATNPWGLKLFGEKPFRFVFTAAYNYVDANIEFYQQRGILLQIGVFNRW